MSDAALSALLASVIPAAVVLVIALIRLGGRNRRTMRFFGKQRRSTREKLTEQPGPAAEAPHPFDPSGRRPQVRAGRPPWRVLPGWGSRGGPKPRRLRMGKRSPAGKQVRPSPAPLPDVTHRLAGKPSKPTALHVPVQLLSWTSGVAADGGLFAGLTARVATIRGRAHQFHGERGQDAFGLSATRDGRWVVGAVADGLGSTVHADQAAQTAVRSVVKIASDIVDDVPPARWEWNMILREVGRSVEVATRSLGRPLPAANPARRQRPLGPPATTLTVVVVPANGVAGTGVVVGVGDSPAYLLRSGAWRRLLPQDSQPASAGADNATDALPAAAPAMRLVSFDWRPGDLVVVASDGFGNALAGGGTPLGAALAEAWQEPPSLLGFLRDVDFRLSTFNDDRTVLALWCGAFDTAVS
ncbi:protein phosphatase 2C domain-containing protein [Micromonospora sp. AP08]|uniref:protein phosphatase 2C domain-containing protein n=1 Tax=Micromonospora sp. AP08 TaxID=2604467 RepID=UPI001651CA50|nr:protein phosphatase 2C domain-containing protein [Micromonospora sp. AP08]